MAFSPHTLDLLGAAKLKWHGDARDSDLPRVVSTKSGQMAHIPWSDFTDNRVLRSSSMDLWDVYKEAFDYLYLREPGSYLPLSLHCHNGGRPMITAIYHKLFTYFAQFPDIWFASHAEIADWVLQEPVRGRPEAPAQGVEPRPPDRVPGSAAGGAGFRAQLTRDRRVSGKNGSQTPNSPAISWCLATILPFVHITCAQSKSACGPWFLRTWCHGVIDFRWTLGDSRRHRPTVGECRV